MPKFETLPDQERREESGELDHILEHKVWSRRPLMEDFEGVFDAEKIRKDKETADRIKQNFEDEGEIQKESEALEILVSHNIEQSEWFGPNAFSSRASEFDDIVNNVDTVVEFLGENGEESERMILAIDEFNGEDENDLKKKVTRAISHINLLDPEHEPQTVEYFESPADPNNRGRLENVIPLVTGMDKENSEELFGKAAHLARLEESSGSLRRKLRGGDLSPGEESEDKKILELQVSKIKELKDEIAHHWVQMLFIEEVLIQLEGYAKLYQEGAIDLSEEVIESINEIYNIFTGLRDKKQIGIPKSVLDDEGSILAKFQRIFEDLRKPSLK